MEWLWFIASVAVAFLFYLVARSMAAGRSNAAKVWAEMAFDLGPLAWIAILFTKMKKPDA